MILCDWQIEEEINKGGLKVDPLDKSLINPMSLDFRLGRHYSKVRATGQSLWGTDNKGALIERFYLDGPAWGYPGGQKQAFEDALQVIDPTDKSTFEDEAFEASEYYLEPQETVNVSMLESIEIAPYLSFKLVGKSSLARLAIDNSSPGGWAESEWKGFITCEITNHSKFIVKLTEGMRIGQILIFSHELPNKTYKDSGRYRDQKPGSGSLGV